MKKGVLLINLGTPDDASPQAVKRFLTEFLTDKRVISLPLPLRHFLVRGLIIPLRLKKVSHAYESIGLPEGMPLRLYTQQIVDKLNHIWEKREDITFAFGMRYGSPSISTALDKIKDCDQITVLPLYPHYTGSTTVSALDALFSTLETDLKQTKATIRIPADIVTHEVNHKISTSDVQGNSQDGFLYTVEWFDNQLSHKLECVTQTYSRETLSNVITMAKNIDAQR
jgi:ferrochelatase